MNMKCKKSESIISKLLIILKKKSLKSWGVQLSILPAPNNINVIILINYNFINIKFDEYHICGVLNKMALL